MFILTTHTLDLAEVTAHETRWTKMMPSLLQSSRAVFDFAITDKAPILNISTAETKRCYAGVNQPQTYDYARDNASNQIRIDPFLKVLTSSHFSYSGRILTILILYYSSKKKNKSNKLGETDAHSQND